MEIRKKMLLSVVAVALAFSVVGQSQTIKAKPKAAFEKQEATLVWGAERLGAAQDISSESKSQIRKLVRDGGLFFNTSEMRDVLIGKAGNVAACDSDCRYCCCNPDGSSCRCCE